MIVGDVVPIGPITEKKAPAHYVDNKKFFEALVEYRRLVLDAAERGEERPRVTEYIGECFLKIATHLSYKANFINYTYKDDMISDGIENCLTAVIKFDPERGMNPVAYFTQIIHYAFIRRIEREKKHSYIKYKYAIHRAQQKDDYAADGDKSFDIKDSAWASYENVHDFIRNYEEKLVRVRAARAIDHDRRTDNDVVSFDALDEER